MNERDGFVLPIVIFGLVLMSTVAVAALLTADDEQRSSRAVRESAAAFYAAEAGVNEVWATWPDSQVSELAPGDSLDLGWHNVTGGASYRAIIHRQDNGGQRMFALRVEGRGPGPRGGQRMVALRITAESASGSLWTPWNVMGAVTGRGSWTVSGGGAYVDGHDHVPTNWDAVCPETLIDAPGVVWSNNNVMTGGGGWIDGVPPVVVDPAVGDDSVFNVFNDVTWDSLTALADYTITSTGSFTGAQPKVSGGECVTPWYGSVSGPGINPHAYNMGSNDPSNPCFDYFPIVHLKGNGLMLNGTFGNYGQGIFLVEGSITLASAFQINGIWIQKSGWVTLGASSDIHGAALFNNSAVTNGGASGIHWSSCGAQRATMNANVEWGGETTYELLSSRSFGEMLR